MCVCGIWVYDCIWKHVCIYLCVNVCLHESMCLKMCMYLCVTQRNGKWSWKHGVVHGKPKYGHDPQNKGSFCGTWGVTGENCWSGKGTRRSALQRRRTALAHRHIGQGEIRLRRRVRQISRPKWREAIQTGKERVIKGVKLQVLFKWLINRKSRSSHWFQDVGQSH